MRRAFAFVAILAGGLGLVLAFVGQWPDASSGAERKASGVPSRTSEVRQDGLGPIDEPELIREYTEASPTEAFVPERGDSPSIDVGAIRTVADVAALNDYFEVVYGHLGRAEIVQEFTRAFEAVDVAHVNALHHELLARGEFEAVGRGRTNEDGSISYSAADYRRKGDLPYLVQFHSGSEPGSAVRTELTLSDLGRSHDAVAELIWLHQRAAVRSPEK